MSARQQNNVEHLLIGGTATITTGAISNLGSGEIGIFNAGGTRLTEATATEGMEFFLAVGGTSPLVRTPLIKGSDVKSAAWKAYSAAAQQLDYIGYNGSAQSIEAIDNNLYMVQVYIEDYLTSSHDGRYIKHFQYESDSSATQSEIALGLAKSGNFNFSREAKNSSGLPPVICNAVCSDAGTANAADAGADYTHLTFVNGSKYATGTISGVPALGSDETNDDLVVGAFLRAGTATTSPVFKIVAATAGTGATPAGTPFYVELDRPYVGATTNIAIASTEYITAALGAAADWGVSVEAQAKDYKVGKEFHGVLRFTLNAKDFGTTVVTNSTAADAGVGEVNSLKDLEWFCKGNQGEYFRMGEPTIHSYTSDVDSSVAGSGYDFLSLKVESSHVVGFQNNISPMLITLATPATAPNYVLTGATDDITDVLEVILYGSANGNLAWT